MAVAQQPVLTAGPLSVGLAPQFGGALAWLRWQGSDLLRPLPEGAERHPTPERISAAYPLVPYSNRIADARFEWQGRHYELQRNFGKHPHSLHGFSWQRPWTLTQQGSQVALMTLTHSADGNWPWSCTAEQHLSLDAQGLTLTLSLNNQDRTDMPAGLGWHPYFLRTEQMTLQFSARRQWTMNEYHLPEQAIPVPASADFSRARQLGWPGLDHCFSGWPGEARLYWPEHGLAARLLAPEFGHLVVFTPEQRNFVAIEPVTHVSNAINWPQPEHLGLQTLPPGARITRTLQLLVEPQPSETTS